LRIGASVAAILLSACASRRPFPVPDLPRAAFAAPGARTRDDTPVPRAEPSASSPPTEAASASPGTLPEVSLGEIGSPGELRLLASSSRGAWVAFCSSDDKTPRLVLGSGTGEPVDDVLAQDPSGRYVVVARGNGADLIDAGTSSRVDLGELGADVRRARTDYAEHRTLSFDPTGRFLSYLRRRDDRSSIVVRELSSGTERAFSAGPGDVFRLHLSADGRYVTFDALREDTNHNGKLDWPVPEERGFVPCNSRDLPKFRSFAYQARGDAVTRAALDLADGSVRDVPGLLTPLAAGLLVRDVDGSLELEQNGKHTPLAPATCDARVLFADAERSLVLAACTPPPPPPRKPGHLPPAPTGKRDVWLFGPGFAKNLQSELYETTTDREATIGARLVPLYPGASAGLVDLERRELLPLSPGSRVIATHGSAALIWRDADLFSYDAQTKSERRLSHGVLKNPDLMHAGGAVLLSPFVVVDLDGPALSAPPRPLALAANGYVLTDSGDNPAGPLTGPIRGPLHWVQPTVLGP